MLKIEKLKNSNMAADGKQILRSLQNTEFNELDLLVRESIQNSLDAGYEAIDVEIDFTIGNFKSSNLYSKLEGVENFVRLLPNEEYSFLVLSDKNTVGLNGPLSNEHEPSKSGENNLLKLVYDFGKAQSKEGAGGSWGYGKSVYYRVGQGMVFYYSRIKLSNGNYEERLAGCFIEDQDKKDTLLSYDNLNKKGIAWWGEYLDGSTSTIPVRDNEKITKFLEVFDITQYGGTDTGTKIIIPFIDEEKLMESIKKGPSLNSPDYYYNILEYLKYSVQRWYAPRLNNNSYKYGKRNNLIVSLNSKIIDENEQNRYFEIIREMYNYAINENNKNLFSLVKKENVIRKVIKTQNIESIKLSNPELGTFVHAKLRFDDFNMTHMHQDETPTFLSNLIGEESKDTTTHNLPIVAFTRQPGMIVNYNNRGEWVQGTMESPIEEYVIGVFVLNSDESTYFNTKFGNKTLEQYVRLAEKSDHMEWYDDSFLDSDDYKIDPKVVSKLKRNVSSTLRDEHFKPIKSKHKPTDVSEYMSSYLGNKIMPNGVGNAPSKIYKSDDSKTGTTRVRKTKYLDVKLLVGKRKYELEKIVIPFEIYVKKDFHGYIEFEVLIDSIIKKVTINDFESDILIKSPLSLNDLQFEEEFFDVEYIYTQNNHTKYSAILKSSFSVIEEGEIIKGNIVVESNDKSIVPIIEINEVVNNE